LDRFAKPLFAEIDHLLRCFDAREEGPAGNVDTGVSCLGGKNDGDQQLVNIVRFELGRWRGVRFRKPAEEFEHLLAVHWRSSSAAASRFSASLKSDAGKPKPTRKCSGISNQRPGTTAVS